MLKGWGTKSIFGDISGVFVLFFELVVEISKYFLTQELHNRTLRLEY